MSHRKVDLRSDTVTLPKPEMMEAILQTSLGDDILGEDSTVRELELKAAKLLGMEDALLVISGTMANQIAIMTYVQRGQEVILGKDSHIYNLEGGAIAVVSQAQPRPIEVIDGYYNLDEIKKEINTGDLQRAKTGLICLENTYNLNKGQIISLENLEQIKEVAYQNDVPVYMDGARIFNAVVEVDMELSDISKYVDAIQFCLTKGLGCPLGSVLAGTSEFIKEARQNRQRLGGGMRQAGIIAAPGIYALDHMINRLKEDNRRAAKLSKSLDTIDGIEVNLDDVQTNIVSPNLSKEGWYSDKLIECLGLRGIKVKKIGEKQVRMIVHYQISDDDVDYVISAVGEVLGMGDRI